MTAPTAPYGRGTCQVCGYEFNLKKNGTVRVHGDAVQPLMNCDGASRMPERVNQAAPEAQR